MSASMWAVCVVLCVLCSCACGDNLLPFGDFERGGRADRPPEFWHRAGGDYMSAYPHWRLVSEDAAAGKYCVTTATNKELVVCGECGGGKIKGSLQLRASRPITARIRLSWWNRLTRTDEAREVKVGPTWQRFELETEARQAGPVELAVAKMDSPGHLWADEFQVEGRPPTDQMAQATYRVPSEKFPNIAAHLANLQKYAGEGKDTAGRIKMKIVIPANAAPLPVLSGGVAFPKGRLFRAEHVQVLDATDREVPAQIEVLARWYEDQSIKMLLVSVPTPRSDQDMTLVFGPNITPSAVTGKPPEPPLDVSKVGPFAVDGEGVIYRSRVLSRQTEREGPLLCVHTVRGELRSENNKRLGRYVTRYTAFRSSSLIHVAHCWINDEPSVLLPIQSAAFDLTMRPEAVAVRDLQQNHPTKVSATEQGCRIWLWPESAKGVLLPQGIARQWEFLCNTAGQAIINPYQTESLPVLMAEPEWVCASGVFEFLLPPDPQNFPIFEQRVGSIPTLGSFSKAEKDLRDLYGLFNYGDAPGDGGWANLESMADHELFLHWMRTGSREHLDMARLAAEHYRDVDIHHGVGFCHTHCNNHTSSEEGWSHAWIQGVRDLYFLFGDLRALEVLYEVGECLLTKEVGWTSGRDWTRPIDNLVDIFGATGDLRFLDCAMKHVAELGRRQNATNSICGAEKGSWYEDRYPAGCAFTWYGCQAMAKLHYETNDPMVLEILRREIDLSLDVKTKSLRSHTILPDEPVSEDKQAYVLANPFALGRGSTLFPPLGYLAHVTGDKRYLHLGMNILAHYMLNLRGGSDASATAYATVFLHYAKRAGLGAGDEAAAFQRARDFSFEQWPKGLANGGFEDGFAHWDVKKIPGKEFYYDELVRVGYYLDGQVKRSGARSLRLHSDNRSRAMSVKGSFGLKPMTRWRASVWVKADPTMNPGVSLSLREYDTDSVAGHVLRPTGKREGDWEERAAEFMTVDRTVATVTFSHSNGTGDAWFDDLALQELGPAESLLTNNGGGRDWRKPAYGRLNVDVGGSYTPDEPMTGDAKTEGRLIPFTLGCLTDGEAKYNHLQKPLPSYCYWTQRKEGTLTFTLGKPCHIRRVRVNILNEDKRRSHGTEKIELFITGQPPLVIAPAKDGWNEFANLQAQTDTLTLKFTAMPGRTYLTISEVEIWGFPLK